MTYALHIPMRAVDVRRYEPLDELLDHPRIRILRLLLRREWLSGSEIREELDATYSPQIASVYSSHLVRCVGAGMLVTRPAVSISPKRCAAVFSSQFLEYSITDLGRRELPELLARASDTKEGIDLTRLEAYL